MNLPARILIGFGTNLRSMWMIFMRAFRKRATIQYPEQAVYLPPRYRGRIVLTRDPDGDERCVACNLLSLIHISEPTRPY